MHKPLRLLALLALLSACGGDDDGTPSDQAKPDAGDVKDSATQTKPTDSGTTKMDAFVPPTNSDAGNLPVDTDSGAPVDVTPDATTPVTMPSADEMLSANLMAKFGATCNAFKAGNWSSDYFAVRDSYERCVANCVVNADCTVFTSTFCTAPSAPSTLLDCVATCDDHPADGFTCGNGTKITFAYVCNGKNQCPDGADEQNCPAPFTCTNGTKLASKLVCDGVGQCCNGAANCTDFSDEMQGCAACK